MIVLCKLNDFERVTENQHPQMEKLDALTVHVFQEGGPYTLGSLGPLTLPLKPATELKLIPKTDHAIQDISFLYENSL